METRLLNPDIESVIPQLVASASEFAEPRRARLREIAAWIAERGAAGEDASLTFICTHNSRRSHISQLWAQALAWKFGLDHVRCYSGGTEATAFHPNAVAAMRACGFDIETNDESDNPIYHVRYSGETEPVTVFSKTFGDAFNPSAGFAAIMTCNDADEACPFVPGASARFALPYDDPKASDGTPDASRVYLERSLHIAAEMLYLMQKAAG
jgi:arsenate reductase